MYGAVAVLTFIVLFVLLLHKLPEFRDVNLLVRSVFRKAKKILKKGKVVKHEGE